MSARAGFCSVKTMRSSRRPDRVAVRPLLGVPIGIKDVLAVKGQPLNCGSKILGKFISPYDATVIEKLRAAGAIVFGRLNMDEFAMGSSTENSAFGATRNSISHNSSNRSTSQCTFLPGGKPLRVLLTGGASCPDGIIQQVITRINALFPVTELHTIAEVLAGLLDNRIACR